MSDENIMKLIDIIDESLTHNLGLIHEEDGKHCPTCAVLNEVVHHFMQNGLTVGGIGEVDGIASSPELAPPGATLH